MAQVEAILPAAAEPPATAHRNIPSLFAGMVLKPRATLAYLRDHGGHSWVWPALAALVLTLASQAVLGPIQRAQVEARIAEFQSQQGQQGQEGEGGQATGPTQVQFGTPSPVATYGLPIGLLAGGWLVRAALIYLFSKVFGGKGSLGAMARMSMWTTLPDSVRILIVTVVSAITGTVSVPGLAFLRQAGPGVARNGFTPGGGFTMPSFPTLFVGQLLGRLDVYTVWGLVLVGLGVAITARLSTLKAILVTGGFWFASLALSVAPQMLGMGLGRFLGGGSGLPGGGRFFGPGGGGGVPVPPPGGGGAPPNVVIVPGP